MEHISSLIETYSWVTYGEGCLETASHYGVDSKARPCQDQLPLEKSMVDEMTLVGEYEWALVPDDVQEALVCERRKK